MSGIQSCSLSIVGDGSVGKSTVTAAFRSDGFSRVYKQTVGVDFYEKQLNLRDNVPISLRLWDVGGQSIQSRNLELYVAQSDVVLLMYDVTNPESFLNLEDWLERVQKYSKSMSTIFLVGNKVDLIALRQVTQAQHEKFILDNKLQGGMFVSAKTGENVVKTFYKVAGEALGVRLTDYELAFHDKVLSAHVDTSKGNESKNAWAEEIEKEDLRLEMEKKRREKEGCTCTCS